MSKYFLSFHTIFVLDENVKWLEEFIIYYLHIGFEHFYLFDNSKSKGRDGSTKDKTKYGFTIDTNSDENIQTLNTIIAKYIDKITYIKWEPKNEENEIVYGHTKGIKHFISNYGNETTWIAFLDLDEFIYSKRNINIRNYFTQLDDNISCVKIVQKKFEDRFLSKNRYITQNYKCINKDIGFEWAPKNIIKCVDFVDINNIHDISVKNKILYEDPNILRFNHYNVNDTLLSWMKDFYKSKHAYTLDDEDYGMKQYEQLFTTGQDENYNYYDNHFVFLLLFIIGIICYNIKNIIYVYKKQYFLRKNV